MRFNIPQNVHPSRPKSQISKLHGLRFAVKKDAHHSCPKRKTQKSYEIYMVWDARQDGGLENVRVSGFRDSSTFWTHFQLILKYF